MSEYGTCDVPVGTDQGTTGCDGYLSASAVLSVLSVLSAFLAAS